MVCSRVTFTLLNYTNKSLICCVGMWDQTLDWYVGPYLAVACLCVFICWFVRKWRVKGAAVLTLMATAEEDSSLLGCGVVLLGVSWHFEGSEVFGSTRSLTQCHIPDDFSRHMWQSQILHDHSSCCSRPFKCPRWEVKVSSADENMKDNFDTR